MRKLSELAKLMAPVSSRAILPCALFCIALIFGIKAIYGAAVKGENDPASSEASVRKAYADKVRQIYAFPFIKDKIALPGNAAVEGGDFLEPTAFPDAKYCGHCHQEAYHQWRQSLHSNPF